MTDPQQFNCTRAFVQQNNSALPLDGSVVFSRRGVFIRDLGRWQPVHSSMLGAWDEFMRKIEAISTHVPYMVRNSFVSGSTGTPSSHAALICSKWLSW